MGRAIYGELDFTSFSLRLLSIRFQTSRSAVPNCGPPDFISRQPIQFVLGEKFNSCPEGALPPDIVGINNVHDEDVMIIGEVRVLCIAI
jgi:hypothetical protein